MRLLPCGDAALLVELDDLDQVLALAAALQADPPRGLVDLVPAARTLLVLGDPQVLAGHLRGLRPARAVRAPGPLVEVPVVYDGEDLGEVARLTGLAVPEVVQAHTGRDWTVGFVGFAPGFAYLTGGDPRLSVPRRRDPRTRVPAGAVGLAGDYSGVYPRASPGGWQLLGRTSLAVWDEARDPPALLQPGTRVRFREAG